MTPFDRTPDPDDPARLALESRRTCDRLRSMSLTRLDAPLADGRSRARAAFDLAQRLTDQAAAVSGRPSRALPELGASAAGDAVAVCAQDLADELREHPGELSAALCAGAVAALIELRQLL